MSVTDMQASSVCASKPVPIVFVLDLRLFRKPLWCLFIIVFFLLFDCIRQQGLGLILFVFIPMFYSSGHKCQYSLIFFVWYSMLDSCITFSQNLSCDAEKSMLIQPKVYYNNQTIGNLFLESVVGCG